MRWSAAFGVLLAVGLGAQRARAAAPAVLVAISECESVDEAEVRRLLAAELGATAAERPDAGVTFVSVRCERVRVLVRVEDPLSRKVVERAFETVRFGGRARARLIAIAASELVLSSWNELESNPRPQVPPLGAEAPAQAREAAVAALRDRRLTLPPGELSPGEASSIELDLPSRELSRVEREKYLRSLRVLFLASTRAFFDSASEALYGGGVRVSDESFAYASWSADFLIEGGQLGEDGVYDVQTVTAGGWILLYQRMGPVTGRLGAGVRTGVIAASVVGENEEGTTVAPWGWPLAAASFVVRLGGRAVLDLSGEAGYVVLPVPASAEPGLRGAWFSAQIGLGFLL